jgi:hypothetical protein
MNRKPSVVQLLCLLGLLAQVSANAAGMKMEEPQGVVYGVLDHLERIEYTESDPIREKFDWGRMAATHWLLGFGLKPGNGWYFGGIVGPGTTELHSGEGQTIEYSTILMGAETEYWQALSAVPGLGILARGRYVLTFSDDGDITEVARDTVTEGGRTDLTWNELLLGVAATMDYNGLRFEAGLEYVNTDIKQDWNFSDGRASSSSTLSPEDDMGLRFGSSWLISEMLEVELTLTMGHRSEFRTGVSYTF